MKLTLFLFALLFAYAAAETASQEGIWKDFGRKAKEALKDLGKQVGRDILEKTRDILTDGLRIKPTKEVQEALSTEPSQEGIFESAAEFIFKKAAELAAAHQADSGFSHEGITTFGPVYKLYEAEQLLNTQYNKSIHYDGPSHEGIFGGLGGLVVRGLGDLIGGKAGGIIKNAGDIVGQLFFAVPQAVSKEGIAQLPSHEGILSSSAKLVYRGAAKLARGVLKGYFGPINKVLGNIFLSRGHFRGYDHYHVPAKELISQARNRISQHQHPEAKFCFETAEHNFTTLFTSYSKNGENCVNQGERSARLIVSHVRDIVLDAVKKVEDSHRELGYCFDKEADDDKMQCLNQDIPDYVAEHRKKILHYGDDLAHYVRQFTEVNTEFDVCLVRHLGEIRREIYYIVEDFHYCVEHKRHRRF